MQLNFFTWVREGMKQSILLGVSDAVETIGNPVSGDELQKRLQEAIQTSALPAPEGRAGTTKRKRLGKSLKDLEPSTK